MEITQVPSLIVETSPFYTSNHIESEEYTNFSSILFDHLQNLDQYKFSLPTISFIEIPLHDVAAFSSNISARS
jgi:hypothetical protein